MRFDARASLSGAACAALLLLLSAQGAAAQPAPGACDAKHADISRDIDAAKAKGQTRRARGLETALRESKANCSDAKLLKEHQARVERQEKKVAERERDLEKAKAEGKARKIASREGKLAEERAALEKVRAGR